jgi:hypothetical protein
MPRVIYSHKSKLGGYMLFILQFFAELLGDGRFLVLTLVAPENVAQREYVAAMFRPGRTNKARNPDGTVVYFRSEAIAYSYLDGKRLILVVLGENNGWLSFARQSGVIIKGMGKVVKRLKAFNRPTLLGAHFENLDVEVVADDAFSAEDLDAAIQAIRDATPVHLQLSDEEYKERLLDGWVVISDRVLQEMISQSEFHADPFRRFLQIRKARRLKVGNVRITTDLGFIKGNCAVAKMDADVRVAASGIKAEIFSANHFLIILEPQEIGEHVITNAQTMINLPKLFRQSDIVVWVKEHFASLRSSIENGQLFPSVTELDNLRYKRMKELDAVDEGISSAMQYSAIEYVMRGGDITKSRSMLTMVAKARYNNLIDRKGNVRVPVPCAVHAQVISQSSAKMAGHDIVVPRGALRFCKELECFVNNDIDYIMDYDNHGGRDLDDFYDIFFREMDGRRVMIVVRSPNGKGEYSIYDYVEGDYHPVWTKSDGSTVIFPEVNGKGWPKRVSEALNDGSLVYTGLPSKGLPKVEEADEEYSIQSVLSAVDDGLGGDSSPGMYINARMLWDQVFPGLRKEHICSLEDAIDTFVQVGTKVDKSALNKAAVELIEEVVASGRTIDRYFWRTRNFKRSLPKGTPVELGDGQFTRTIKLLKDHTKEFEIWLEGYIKDNMSVPDALVGFLGGKQASLKPVNQRTDADNILKDAYQRAFAVLKEFNARIGAESDRAELDVEALLQANPWIEPEDAKASIGPERWPVIFQPVMEEFQRIEQEQGIVARHTFAMALMAASYSNRTKRGIVNDTIVWNAKQDKEGNPTGPFRYMVDAMRFFGLLGEVDVDDLGHLRTTHTKSWDLTCTKCGKSDTVDKPMVLQRFHLLGQMCRACRS